MKKITISGYEQHLKAVYTNPNTIQQYLEICDRYMRVSDIVTQEGVNKFLSIFANNTINRAGVKALCEYVGTTVKPPKYKGRKKVKSYKFILVEKINELLDAIDTEETSMEYLVTYLMFNTGLRLSEVFNLKVSGIDFKSLLISGIGKGNKEFDEAITEEMAELLFDHIDDNQLSGNDLLFKYSLIRFPNKKYWKFIKKKGKEVGIINMTPHKLRHSLAYFLRKNCGWDLAEIKVKLRHSDISTTQIYATATKEEVQEKIRRQFS